MANRRYNNGYVELRDAIRRKDRVRAQSLILNHVSVNNPRLKCNTPLHWAILQFKDLEIMTMLLNNGANVHAKNHRNLKPLEIAIQNDKTEAAILLIERGALTGENLNALLEKAIEKNHHIVVKNIIDYGIQYNISIDFSILFDAAVSRGYAKTLEHILPHCRFLKASDKYVSRKIVIKPGSQYKECVELLLKWNFYIKPNSNRDQTFVYGAVENGHLEIFLQLLKLGIDVNLVNPDTGLNLLKIACINKHHEIVENLLKHHAFVNETTSTITEVLNNLSIYSWNSSLLSSYNKKNLCGLTCLHIAVLNSDPIMTRLLLKYGAKIIDDPTFFNITCIAVQNNCEEIVRIFLDQGVDVNDFSPQGNTLLHFCVNTSSNARDSRYNIAKLLLEKGAITHMQTPGNLLIFEAVTNGHHKIAQLFLDYNADIQYISLDGDTLLHKAIEKEFDIEFIKTLLKRNAPVNAVNNYLLTPLHIICKLKNSFNINIIELLLKNNANIEAVDARGWTPIFYACKANNGVAVKYLLDHHVDANHTDLENLTPLYIAAKYCRYDSEVVKILLEYKVNVYCFDKQGNSIIHVIVANHNAELIKSLARTLIDFNSVNKDGTTPLHIAIENESYDVIENLIKYGANINVLDGNLQTPLHNAIEHMAQYHNSDQDHYYRDSYWDDRYSSDNSNDDEYDNDYYGGDIDTCKDIIRILKMQVLKLKTAGLMINKQNLQIVYDRHYYTDDESFIDDMNDIIDPLQFEEECEQEIEKIRMESIGVNSMTLYDLLKKNIYILSRFVKNKKIQQKLDLEVYDEKFPLYIDIIRGRFRDAKLRYRLTDYAKKYFSSNVCSRLSDDCIDTVFSYLKLKEIRMFIRAMK